MAMISPCRGSLVWFAAAVGCHGPEVLGQPTGQVVHEHATVGTAVGEDGAFAVRRDGELFHWRSLA